MQRTLFCISIAFLLSISARAQVIETYAESGASYSPPLFPLFPGDTGTKDLQDRHLAAVPSATQLDLAGITANASAKLKSLAIVSDASFSESSTSLIPSVSYDAFTEARFGDTITFHSPTLEGQKGNANVQLIAKGGLSVTGNGDGYSSQAGASYKITIVNGLDNPTESGTRTLGVVGDPQVLNFGGSDFTSSPILGKIPFIFGQPVTIEVQLTATASIRVVDANDGHPPGAHANADFSHTLNWGGITAVTDQNGNSISDWSVTSASGTDYSVGVTNPIANAGQNQTAQAGTLVTLDGTGSSDPNNLLPLTYAWSFVSKPPGSAAVLSNSIVVNPIFTPDAVGNYVIQLIVTDTAGFSSTPATVTVSTVDSPPVADAGPDQAITVIGTVLRLDGSQSYSPNGLSTTYQWSILSKPAGSNAALSGPTTAMPSFVADIHGTYTIQLIVTDSLGTASSPAIVTVTSNNTVPVASAGLSQSAVVGQTVTLNGSGSSDADGDPLTYRWSLASAPSGSQAVVSNPTAQIASFVPDLPGTFVAQLIINDGLVDSPPATAQIQVVTIQTEVIQNIQRLQQNVIASLAPGAFKNQNMQNALLNKLNAVIANMEAGKYSDALGQLQNDILGKTDGCTTSGAPDKNDWIVDCPDQSKVYTPLLNIIAEVKALCGC